MVLSDHSIREEIAAGRLVIDPFDDALVQPCSVDVRVGDSFRVFRNARYPYIDVKREMEDLTELVRVGPCPTTWSRRLTARAPWAGWGSSSTRRPG
jgi:dCTP deaminase